MNLIHGWVNFDKPKGISSFKAVSLVKKYFLVKKAGHAGTLDPLASGVLPIALGEATKTTSFMMDSIKTYNCLVEWGSETSTDDEEGEVIKSTNKTPTKNEIELNLKNFIGKISQIPPKFSAIKVNGKRSYSIARKGETPNLQEREIEVKDLKLVEVKDNNQALIFIKCSKGTYVRSLVRDLGRKLGVFAHVKDLRRSSVGNFNEKNSISLDHLNEIEDDTQKISLVLPIESALEKFIKLEVSLNIKQKLVNGVKIPLNEILKFDEKDKFRKNIMILAQIKKIPVALCIIDNSEIKPFRVFNI